MSEKYPETLPEFELVFKIENQAILSPITLL
jgi:hypothetical protein